MWTCKQINLLLLLLFSCFSLSEVACDPQKGDVAPLAGLAAILLFFEADNNNNNIIGIKLPRHGLLEKSP